MMMTMLNAADDEDDEGLLEGMTLLHASVHNLVLSEWNGCI